MRKFHCYILLVVSKLSIVILETRLPSLLMNWVTSDIVLNLEKGWPDFFKFDNQCNAQFTKKEIEYIHASFPYIATPSYDTCSVSQSSLTFPSVGNNIVKNDIQSVAFLDNFRHFPRVRNNMIKNHRHSGAFPDIFRG